MILKNKNIGVWIKTSERLPVFHVDDPPYVIKQFDGNINNIYFNGESSVARWINLVDEWQEQISNVDVIINENINTNEDDFVF